MITINSVSYGNVNNVTIRNGKVTIDGVLQEGNPLSGIVRIEVKGDLASLNTDANVVVGGDVRGDVDAGGNVTCANVGGYVDAGCNVTCANVGGQMVVITIWKN